MRAGADAGTVAFPGVRRSSLYLTARLCHILSREQLTAVSVRGLWGRRTFPSAVSGAQQALYLLSLFKTKNFLICLLYSCQSPRSKPVFLLRDQVVTKRQLETPTLFFRI